MKPWFTFKDFVRLEINTAGKTPLISHDAAAIKQLVARIERLPADGDKMKSFSEDVERVSLSFYTKQGSDSDRIEIYRDQFKTPSTGFNSTPSEEEKNLALELKALFSPSLNKKLLKLGGVSVEDKTVKFTYVRSIHEANDQPGMPTIGPTNEDHFEVVNKRGGTHTVKIYSGQNPPQPELVKVGEDTYVIHTFKSSKGESLYDSHFEIVKKK